MMERFVLPQDMGQIEIIAGEYKGVQGPAFAFSLMHLLNVKLKSNSESNFAFPKDYNTGLLVIEGEVIVNGESSCSDRSFCVIVNDGEEFSIHATEGAVVLVLSGEPIHEPIAPYGSFVMNTRDELIQAFDNFNNGKFGYLED